MFTYNATIRIGETEHITASPYNSFEKCLHIQKIVQQQMLGPQQVDKEQHSQMQETCKVE
jgi:hypothetical protein